MKKVAILCGGFDGERSLSLLSANIAEQNLVNKFKTYRIVLADDTFAFVHQTATGNFPVNRTDFTFPDQHGNIIRPDVILMLIHGEPGSSGTLLAYFELLKIPFTCCNALTAGLFFNKRLTNLLAGALGISVPKSLWMEQGDPLPTVEQMESIGFPAIVKPVNGGFSLGVNRIMNHAELPAAVAAAFKEDHQILIESFITGREIAVGVMRTEDGIVTLPCCEVSSKNGFLTHEDKITASFKKTFARLSITEQTSLETITKKIYHYFNCRGVVRVDFIWANDGNLFLLEVNSVPGMAPLSIVPDAVAVLGWTMEYFFTQLIERAGV
jgi:D-alanine-D-alanine ligase